MTNVPIKPTSPEDDDCCGGGACNPCVWDAYNEKMRHWRTAQAKANEEKAAQESSKD